MGQVFSYFLNYFFGRSQKSLKNKEENGILYDVYLLMSGEESGFLNEGNSSMDIKLTRKEEDHFLKLAAVYKKMHENDNFSEVNFMLIFSLFNLYFQNNDLEDFTNDFMVRVEKRRNNINFFD